MITLFELRDSLQHIDSSTLQSKKQQIEAVCKKNGYVVVYSIDSTIEVLGISVDSVQKYSGCVRIDDSEIDLVLGNNRYYIDTNIWHEKFDIYTEDKFLGEGIVFDIVSLDIARYNREEDERFEEILR